MHFSRKSVDKKRSGPGSGGTGLSSQRQADLHDTSLVWRVSSGTARMTQKNPVSKDKNGGGVFGNHPKNSPVLPHTTSWKQSWTD